MFSWLKQKTDTWKQNGALAIIAALLCELLVVLWLSFFALFGLETLLPTFVTIRLSLSNFLAFLILATVFYLFLERQLGLPQTEAKTPRWLIVGAWCFGGVLIALSLARFSLFGVVVFFFGYLTLWWFLNRYIIEKIEK